MFVVVVEFVVLVVAFVEVVVVLVVAVVKGDAEVKLSCGVSNLNADVVGRLNCVPTGTLVSKFDREKSTGEGLSE
jgi:hypothetical protein